MYQSQIVNIGIQSIKLRVVICNTLENSYGIKTKPKFNFRDK